MDEEPLLCVRCGLEISEKDNHCRACGLSFPELTLLVQYMVAAEEEAEEYIVGEVYEETYYSAAGKG